MGPQAAVLRLLESNAFRPWGGVQEPKGYDAHLKVELTTGVIGTIENTMETKGPFKGIYRVIDFENQWDLDSRLQLSI